ncbi:uncharacterized protein MONBRDRAFT_33632 [Monosiga brevicollis MX1]|uniref:Cytochrome b5 domain-containing protein 1 n=1 Tax=Monosiga brevicollis TaxID=81824 RepID=A9V6P5_MONBE|nr:uncharacterized protein MONBRDRAFT_33632 [Monosiga brevicollis MX1]EDQ86771.1 predicted protein [Monosiga brevicollis MX1]|eukprot:XP_001748316.1 hypothetical protein [Monosiga brevicollis MX1]
MTDSSETVRYFTPAEVAAHNCEADIWVSFLGKVLDLTKLVREHQGNLLLKPLLLCAGKDISHWFDPKTGNMRTHIDPITGLELPFTPHGRVLDVPPACPSSRWATNFGTPWWRDDDHVVGRLSERTRLIKVTNMLTKESQTIEVCNEEPLRQIQQRYQTYNSHSRSYTWKHLTKVLDMNLTLAENGVEELADEFDRLHIDRNEFIPELQIYYNDDLLPSA